MPVDPGGQVEQAAAQLGVTAGAGCGEGAVGGVPLLLCVDQVGGEGVSGRSHGSRSTACQAEDNSHLVTS